MKAIQAAITTAGGIGRLSNQTGIKEMTLRRYLAGTPVSRDDAIAISNVTGISAQTLCKDEDDTKWTDPTAGQLDHVFARCRGDHIETGVCERRDTCLRYIARDDVGPLTPVYAHGCYGDQDIYLKGGKGA